MDASRFQNVDLDIFRELLRELLPEGALIAVIDAGGATLWGDDGFPARIAEAMATALAGGTTPPGPQDAATRSFTFEGGQAHAARIPEDSSAAASFLLALLPAGRVDADAGRRLSTAAKAISGALAMGSELDAMATELAERYEELNLVYHTEDQVNYFAEGQLALDNLVRNCCEYLNVSLSALIMKDKGLVLTHQTEAAPIADAQLVLTRLQSGLYETVIAERRPVIINQLTSPEALELWHGMAYKMAAAPILDSKGGVNGILAIANHYGKPDFSNSDKNLLQVMGRKAAKIVQVNYDPLTGLVNREGLEFFAEKLFGDSRSSGAEHCALHFNIDQLHVINDTVSHEAGDAVIKAVAAKIRSGVRDTDVVARIGADEFAVLLEGCPLDRGTDIADKLRERIVDLVIPWTDRSLTATVSGGVAPIDDETDSAAAALAAADLACAAAKEMGKNRVQRYYHTDTALIRRHKEMEAVGQIQTALQEDHFALHAQVIEPVAGGAGHGLHMEILLRLMNAEGEPLSPAMFMPAAERYHLMPDIDRWVVTKTLAYFDDRWDSLAPALDLVSVNLSGQSLGEPGFPEFLIEALSHVRFPLERICFEITETAAVANLEQARDFMNIVKAHGCRFSLDDFGSGLSSFSYLRTLPVDFLKIDGSLVKEIANDEVSASMVAAVRQVGAVMGLETIAEFVENDAIMAKLKEIGVTYAQGYGIGKPKPLAEHFRAPVASLEAAAT